ncbi:hypothetical protein I5735_09380 [Acinetobacter baumannii]|nr:hypothetical protein [Acinetobacter baumannii]
MFKKSLCWGLMATSLYVVSGCSEFKNEQAVGAETAQAEVEEAMTAASEAEPSADVDEEVNNNYEDAGDVNPIEQLIEGVPIDVTFPPNLEVSQIHGHLVYDIAIQSKVDNIVVNEIIINRGNNCNINDYMREKYLPANLKFGRYAKFSTGCDVNYIKEVEVKTNLGNYKFDQFVRR